MTQNTMYTCTLHYCYMSLKICLPHCTCMSQCTAMVIYIYPKWLHIISKNTTSCNFYSYPDVTYVPVTNMPVKCHTCTTYASWMTCILRGNIPIHTPHMKLLSTTITLNRYFVKCRWSYCHKTMKIYDCHIKLIYSTALLL